MYDHFLCHLLFQCSLALLRYIKPLFQLGILFPIYAMHVLTTVPLLMPSLPSKWPFSRLMEPVLILEAPIHDRPPPQSFPWYASPCELPLLYHLLSVSLRVQLFGRLLTMLACEPFSFVPIGTLKPLSTFFAVCVLSCRRDTRWTQTIEVTETNQSF